MGATHCGLSSTALPGTERACELLYGADMYLAASLAWTGVAVAAAIIVILAVVAGRRASRDRKRQAHDRMLPP